MFIVAIFPKPAPVMCDEISGKSEGTNQKALHDLLNMIGENSNNSIQVNCLWFSWIFRYGRFWGIDGEP